MDGSSSNNITKCRTHMIFYPYSRQKILKTETIENLIKLDLLFFRKGQINFFNL